MTAGRPPKNPREKKIDALRTLAWLHYLEHHRQLARNSGNGAVPTDLAEWLNSLSRDVIPDNCGKMKKWRAGTHAPNSTTLRIIDSHVTGSRTVWESGPDGSRLFEALSASYEALWDIAGVTREDMARHVAGSGKFSDNINSMFSPGSAHGHSLLGIFARHVAAWRIIWMSLHSWQNVENQMMGYLQDEKMQQALSEHGVNLVDLCALLDLLRNEYALSDERGRRVFGN